MRRSTNAMSLVEVLIVVMILAIIAMLVVPRLGSASDKAREAALLTDLQTGRSQIKLYTTQHAGRLPHLDENGLMDTTNFVNRLTQRTDIDGKLNPSGLFGPYLLEWPGNPFAPRSVARKVAFGTQTQPPRDDTTGWHYNTNTGILSANSSIGAESQDP